MKVLKSILAVFNNAMQPNLNTFWGRICIMMPTTIEKKREIPSSICLTLSTKTRSSNFVCCCCQSMEAHIKSWISSLFTCNRWLNLYFFCLVLLGTKFCRQNPEKIGKLFLFHPSLPLAQTFIFLSIPSRWLNPSFSGQRKKMAAVTKRKKKEWRKKNLSSSQRKARFDPPPS